MRSLKPKDVEKPPGSRNPEAAASGLGSASTALSWGRAQAEHCQASKAQTPARTPQGITVPRTHAKVSLSTTALLRPCSRSLPSHCLLARDHASRHGGRLGGDAWPGRAPPRHSEERPQGSGASLSLHDLFGTWLEFSRHVVSVHGSCLTWQASTPKGTDVRQRRRSQAASGVSYALNAEDPEAARTGLRPRAVATRAVVAGQNADRIIVAMGMGAAETIAEPLDADPSNRAQRQVLF